MKELTPTGISGDVLLENYRPEHAPSAIGKRKAELDELAKQALAGDNDAESALLDALLQQSGQDLH